MRRLVADYFGRRRGLFSTGVVLIPCMAVLCTIFLVNGKSGEDSLRAYCSLFGPLAAVLGGGRFVSDLQNGAFDVLKTLPTSRRRLAFATWLVSVVFWPAFVLLAILPAMMWAVFSPEGNPESALSAIEEMSVWLAFSSVFCIIVSLMRLLRELAGPLSSVLASFVFLCWVLLLLAACYHVLVPQLRQVPYRFVVLAAPVSVAVAYPAIVLSLNAGSGRYLWFSREAPVRHRLPNAFPSRFTSITRPWALNTVAAIGLMAAFVALASLVQRGAFLRSQEYVFFVLVALLLTLANVVSSSVVSIKMWRTLPLTGPGLAALLASLPLTVLVTAGIVLFCGTALLDYWKFLPLLIPAFCVCVVFSAVREPLALLIGTINPALLVLVGAFGLFGVLWLAKLSAFLLFIVAVAAVAIGYLWLLQLIETDSAVYRRTAVQHRRWGGPS